MDGSPLPPRRSTLVGTLADSAIPSTYEETAVFANGSYKFNDCFKLGAGVRYAQQRTGFLAERHRAAS